MAAKTGSGNKKEETPDSYWGNFKKELAIHRQFFQVFLANEIRQKVTSSFQQFIDIQKRSISIGLDSWKVQKQLYTATKGLPGAFAGLMGDAIDILETGQASINESNALFAAYSRLTGQNSLQQLTAIRSLEIQASLGVTQSASLQDTIVQNSQTYRITSGRLVKSLEELSDTLITAGLFGGGGRAAEAAATVQSLLGAGTEAILPRFIQGITEGTGQGIVRSSLLGVSIDARNAILGVNNAMDPVQALLGAIKSSSLVSENILNNLGVDASLSRGILENILGSQAVDAIILQRELDRRGTELQELIEIGKIRNRLTAQLDVALDTIKQPIVELIYPTLSLVSQFLSELQEINRSGFRGVTAALTGFALTFGLFKAISAAFGIQNVIALKSIKYLSLLVGIGAGIEGGVRQLWYNMEKSNEIANKENDRQRLAIAEQSYKNGAPLFLRASQNELNRAINNLSQRRSAETMELQRTVERLIDEVINLSVISESHKNATINAQTGRARPTAGTALGVLR